MDYLQISFPEQEQEKRDILIALLSELGYESFQETDDHLFAFIPESAFDAELLTKSLPGEIFPALHYNTGLISERNWNKLWEQNFEPVIIADRCRVIAPFHDKSGDYQYEIIIEPQMSFGTAHHATTALMIELMLNLNLNNKLVLDMGCGTGILAIFAMIRKATKAWAIDNNRWAYHNTLHNLKLNRVGDVEVVEGGKEKIPKLGFDMILANINRNVLLEDIPTYIRHLKKNGHILLSGFLEHDAEAIESICNKSGLHGIQKLKKDEWVAEAFRK